MFCELYSGRHFFPYQEQFMKRIIRSILENDGAEITALFSRQSGKCFAKGTKILMYSGKVKPVEQIKVGDKVMRPNGGFAVVTSLGRGRERMYEVRSHEKNHDSFVVNESHILALVNRKGEYENIEVKDYLKLPEWKRKDEYRGYRVSVDFDEKPLPFGFDLIPKGEGNYYGFTIDTPDHLFLLGDYTVVHNTEAVAGVTGGIMILFPTLANMPMFADDPRLSGFKEGVMIGIFAPALMQAQINYNRMRSFLSCNTAQAVLDDPEFNLHFTTSNGQTVRLSNGSFASAFSASDQSNIEGLSFHLIICEEAQDISDFKMLKSISPMGAAYNATQIKVGTATTFKASFYRSIERNKRDMEVKSSHIKNHFEYDCDVATKYNPRYKKYVDAERKRLGENSDEFLMSYKLKWVVERGMLIDVAKFEENNTEPLLGTVEYDMLANHVVGIDVGGSEGGDSTVLTVVEVDWNMPAITESKQDEETGEEIVYNAYTTYLKCWYEIKNCPDYEEQFSLIKDFIHHFKVSKVVIDATREKSLADRLSANLNCEVIPFVFSPKGKSDLYKNFTKEISTGRVRVPFNETTRKSVEYNHYIQQMGDMQKGYRGAYLVCSHPPIKGAHDDYPDSHALAVWGASFEGDVSVTETQDRRKVMGKDEKFNFHRSARSITAKRRR